jgi:hypothetical protein
MPPGLYRSIIPCDDVREIVQILRERKAESVLERPARRGGRSWIRANSFSTMSHHVIGGWSRGGEGEPDYQRRDVWLARKARLQNIANETHRKVRHRSKDDEVACGSLHRSCGHYAVSLYRGSRFVPKRHAIDGNVHDATLCSATRPRYKRWLPLRLVFVSRILLSHREKIPAVTRN